MTGDHFNTAYQGTPPWEIGAPQPDMLSLLDEFPPTAPILDLGCGTGDLALALAARGFRVLGIDQAPVAISRANDKAANAPSEHSRLVEFRVADALHPSQLHETFGAAVDRGFFHIFDAPERAILVGELADTLSPGGRYYMLGFAINSPIPNAPRQVTSEELQALFPPEQGWHILALRPAKFRTNSPRGDIPALALCAELVHSSDA